MGRVSEMKSFFEKANMTNVDSPDSPTIKKEEFKMNPLAAPFHPCYEPVHLHIYNDGVPSMILRSEEDLSTILHGIQDEAIDEGFPPDAIDAAELEEAQMFVEILATLDIMEEREELARNFHIGLRKRWEARRAAGLMGRPLPPMHRVDPVTHLPKSSSCTSIVSYQHAHRMLLERNKMPQKKILRNKEARMANRKTNAYRPPIQQPRK